MLLRALSLVFRALSLFLFLVSVEQVAKADPVTAITGAIGLGGNLLGGIFGKKSANKAADLQAQAAARAKQELIDRTEQANLQIVGGGADVGKQVRTAAGEATARSDEATKNANELLDPYRESGDAANAELSKGLVDGGIFNRNPTMADITIDPGFAFRQSEDQKAIQRSAAAKGGVLGGGVLKALQDRSQALASSEYGAAFERFRKSIGDRFSNLFNVSGRGKDVSSEQGKNLIGAGTRAGDLNLTSAEYAGDKNYDATKTASQNLIGSAQQGGEYDTQAANAKASGIVGGTNALWGGINGGIGAATGAIQLHQILKDPSLNYFRSPGTTRLSGIGGTRIP